jgi:hypothetical protein
MPGADNSDVGCLGGAYGGQRRLPLSIHNVSRAYGLCSRAYVIPTPTREDVALTYLLSPFSLVRVGSPCSLFRGKRDCSVAIQRSLGGLYLLRPQRDQRIPGRRHLHPQQGPRCSLGLALLQNSQRLPCKPKLSPKLSKTHRRLHCHADPDRAPDRQPV